MTTPLHLRPCTQCGECCRAEVCPVGETLLETVQVPCPALEFRDGKAWCGLVTNLDAYKKRLHFNQPWQVEFLQGYLKGLMNFGYGCDSDGK